MAPLVENNDSCQVALGYGKEKRQEKAKTKAREKGQPCAPRERWVI
jgi:hypothetical protein